MGSKLAAVVGTFATVAVLAAPAAAKGPKSDLEFLGQAIVPSGTTFDGSPVCCHASTRRGTPCARVPLPGSKYCPSHKHLDEELEVAAA